MKKYNCPSCGAEVMLQSAASVFCVCQYCRSTLVRHDVDLELVGKMADLKDDSTIFQIGSSGRYKGEFVFVGRVRVSWEDGFWNEWFVRYDDGRDGWLAEAQGFYMISEPVQTPDELPKESDVVPGLVIQIGKLSYTVDDIKQVTYSFAEGELPFAAPQGFHGVSIDLSHGESDFASLSYGANGDVDVFTGKYLEFEKFHFQNVRQLDGW